MKKYLVLVTGLTLTVMQAIAQSETGFEPSIESQSESFSVEPEKQPIRSEGKAEAASAEEPFDAFLTEAGYVVYPVEENCAALQAKITRNPMILRKDFIPRSVRVIRRVDGRRPDGSVNGVLGKQFMIVSEIGSVSRFMVDLKDLHYVQNKDIALDNQESSGVIGLAEESPNQPVKAPLLLPEHKTRILFVCSGNYYRSRFAEAYLKFLIGKNRLPIEVCSRGLSTDMPGTDAVSPSVLAELARRNISNSYAAGSPTEVALADLNSADIVVAMNRQEHQASLEAAFPEVNAKVRYWEIKEGGMKPATACANITYQVQALIQEVVGNSGLEVSHVPNPK